VITRIAKYGGDALARAGVTGGEVDSPIRAVVRSALVPGADLDLGPENGGAAGLDVQLWPHVHGTDAMHLTLLRRTR
jgi:hypothetical protein